MKEIERDLARAKGKEKTELAEARESSSHYTAYLYKQIEECQAYKRNLSEAKPILVGPATLDSLLEREPESYEYVDSGHLPFDNIFFDIVSPVKVAIPFDEKKGDFIGMHLRKIEGNRSRETAVGRELLDGQEIVPEYEYRAFIREDITQGLGKIGAFFRTVEKKGRKRLFIYGSFNFAGEPVYGFTLNPLTGEMEIRVTQIDELSKKDGQSEIYGAPMEKRASKSVLAKLPRLCVNLVNYINSHNVTVIPRKRKGPRKVYDGDQFIEEPSSRHPFHLITIKDGIVEEPREEGKSWELNWRVYVRGHDLKYRDDQGRIYLTTWRRPHVRGPPDAPWREQRYEVLAKKLEEEREMYRQHGIEEKV